MRVTQSGSFTTLPLTDKVRVLAVAPFVLAVVGAYMLYREVGKLFERGPS